jgi:hypothetical protein
MARGPLREATRTKEPADRIRVEAGSNAKEVHMTFGKGALLWLVGIPLPIILLIALFWR